MASQAAENAATDALKSLDAVVDHSSSSPPSPRRWRANRVVGRIIPLLLLSLFLFGWRVVFGSGSPYIRYVWGRPYLALCYATVCRVLFVALAYTFLLVFLAPRGHSRPPLEPPKELIDRAIVHEVANMDAELARCWQDTCNGAWLPARARHCKDCGVLTPPVFEQQIKSGKAFAPSHLTTVVPGANRRHLRQAFIDLRGRFGPSCITGTRTLKPFLLFMENAVALIFVALLPLFPIVSHHLRVVLDTSWHSEDMSSKWWSTWKSWAFGPVWRYAGGLILSYRHHSTLSHAYEHESLRPSLAPIFVLVFATLVFLVGETMIFVSFRHLMRGVTTIEVERARRAHLFDATRFVWLPLEAPTPGGENTDWGGAVVRVPADAPLYDLGWKANLRLTLGEKWYHWINPHHSCRGSHLLDARGLNSAHRPRNGIVWPVNKAYIAQLRDKALKNE